MSFTTKDLVSYASYFGKRFRKRSTYDTFEGLVGPIAIISGITTRARNIVRSSVIMMPAAVWIDVDPTFGWALRTEKDGGRVE